MTTTITLGLATGFVYAIVAVGYSLIYRTTGIVNFAQGAFVMAGAMSTYWLYDVKHLPYAAAIVGGVLAAGVVGAVLWGSLVLPLWRRESAPYVVILATLVFGDLVANVAGQTISNDPQTLPAWIDGFRVNLSGASIDGQYALVIVVALASIVATAVALARTSLGKAMRACASNPRTSQLLGIAPVRVGALAMIGTACLAGLAGVVYAPARYIDYGSALTYGIYGFVAAIIGGFGSLWGALAGGVLLGIVTALAGRYISTDYQQVIAFGILIAFLVCRPQGILGERLA
ncbi:MAG TPA: branched-chain amino acid ABC transporter permease [Solirubrobacter sp.]|nr:branched-chain amino acid ABC transporter permease [Solirubrobacter sp.]